MTVIVSGLSDFVRGLRAADEAAYREVLKAGREAAKTVRGEQQRRAKGSLKRDITIFSNQSGAGVTGGKKLRYFSVNEIGSRRGHIYWHPGSGTFLRGKFHANEGYIPVPIAGGVRMSRGHRIRTKPHKPTGYFFLPGFRAKQAAAADHYWKALERIIDKV